MALKRNSPCRSAGQGLSYLYFLEVAVLHNCPLHLVGVEVLCPTALRRLCFLLVSAWIAVTWLNPAVLEVERLQLLQWTWVTWFLKVVNTVTLKPCNPRLFGTAGFYESTVPEPLPGWLFHLDICWCCICRVLMQLSASSVRVWVPRYILGKMIFRISSEFLQCPM